MRNRQLLTGLLALSCLLVAFIGYIYIHKPFSASELLGILGGLWRSLVAILLISTAGGIGFLTNLRKLDIHPFALAMLTAALGFGAIAIVTLAIGAVIGIHLFLWAILLIGGILLRKQIFMWWRCWQPASEYWQKTSRFGKTIIVLIAVILICQYIVALAPPLQFDTLTYHLAIPKAYLQIGRIVYLPDNMFWGMPELVEMLYALSMLLGGTEAAPILGWWIALIALAGLVGTAETIFGRDAALVAAASLMCAYAFTHSISSGYVEWTAILFGLAMSICLSKWIVQKDRSTLAWAGIFAGMAIGTKYTAGVALLAGFAVILLFQKPYSFKDSFTNLFIFGGMAIAATLPWLVKNAIATGNPFYPLIFVSGAMDATRLAQYQAKTLVQDWSRVLLLPIQATILGVDGGEGYSASIGPLLLGLSPLAFFAKHEKTEEQHIAIKTNAVILLTAFVIWAVASQFSEKLIQTRLYFVIFPAWAFLCAAGYLTISKIKTPGLRFGNIAAAFIVMALGFNTFATLTNFLASGAALAALTPEAHKAYLERNLGAYEVAMQEINQLPTHSQVLMLWETRGFACLPKCDSDEVIDRWPSDWTIYKNSQAILKAWKQAGYTHLLINQRGADFIKEYDRNGPTTESWDALNTLLTSLPLEKDIAGSYKIYTLP
jgi:hypothetical protein